MNWVAQYIWLIPALPLAAAGISAICTRRRRTLAAGLAIGAMSLATILSVLTLISLIGESGQGSLPRRVMNFRWFELGNSWVELGWVVDPLSVVMLVMVSLVGVLIFIYSAGYMAEDENFTRFFCFLSLFAAAMLGLVIANSLLLLFISWELVGLTSYLLIGFWYHKPEAAAAAKKAFITTRVGDLALFLGMAWLYSETGTLLFYDSGGGCIEPSAVASLAAATTAGGMAISTAISLLVFCGAVGKSGQIPLHVWLPDAMEGPTPVSALIHAATMVAAGVFLVARTYPLMSAVAGGPGAVSTALQVVTWTGGLTAVFAASIALAQTDIKRILAYSTVSQLGYMMMGLGVGGVAAGMFHLITHAFFKALLFLGAGSVIHGCHGEQDIRRMGGLQRPMPVTFLTYAVGMLSLSGFPLLFSGFWSKDEILHGAHIWPASHWPFFLGLAGALLTAFYMMRQVAYVFLARMPADRRFDGQSELAPLGAGDRGTVPHESPRVMLAPLVILAFFAIALGFLGTPAWPWFQSFISGERPVLAPAALFAPGHLGIMAASAFVALLGLISGLFLYRGLPPQPQRDPLANWQPDVFALLERRYFIDEAYNATIVRLTAWWARACDWFERWVFDLLTEAASLVVLGLGWLSRVFDDYAVNPGFDQSCGGLSRGGGLLSRFQNGQIQRYLRALTIGLVLLMILLVWGCQRQGGLTFEVRGPRSEVRSASATLNDRSAQRSGHTARDRLARGTHSTWRGD